MAATISSHTPEGSLVSRKSHTMLKLPTTEHKDPKEGSSPLQNDK